MDKYEEIESIEHYRNLVRKLGFEDFIKKYFIDEEDDGGVYCPSAIREIFGDKFNYDFSIRECKRCGFRGKEDLENAENGNKKAEERVDKFINCHKIFYDLYIKTLKKSNAEQY